MVCVREVLRRALDFAKYPDPSLGSTIRTSYRLTDKDHTSSGWYQTGGDMLMSTPELVLAVKDGVWSVSKGQGKKRMESLGKTDSYTGKSHPCRSRSYWARAASPHSPPTALAAAPSNGTVSSTRSFPKQSAMRADPFQESVSTDVQSDTDWGGIETVAGWFVLVCRTVPRPSAPGLARFPPPPGSRFVGVSPGITRMAGIPPISGHTGAYASRTGTHTRFWNTGPRIVRGTERNQPMTGIEPCDWSEMTPDMLLAHMAGLAILQKKIAKALDGAKRQYLRTHDADSPKENAVFAGLDAATVLVKADGAGSYKVDDPLAYADFLSHYGLDCEGQPAVITVNYPTPNAMGERFLERLIREHGGEIPDGVKYQPGRSGGVTVTLGRGIAEHAFDANELSRLAIEAAV